MGMIFMLNWWPMQLVSTTNSGMPRHSITLRKQHKENAQVTEIFLYISFCLDAAGQHSWVLSGGIGYMACPES